MKQYVIKEAYTDNYHVLQYEDGKLENSDIISWYELNGYVEALKGMGYTEAYCVSEYEEKLIEAQESLDLATSEYEKAKKSPLVLSVQETARYRYITDAED